MSKPRRVDGILQKPSGSYAIQDAFISGRCTRCRGPISNVLNGVVICRKCAVLYAVKKSVLGDIFHMTDIVWNEKGYVSACLTHHPIADRCEFCPVDIEEKLKEGTDHGRRVR